MLLQGSITVLKASLVLILLAQTSANEDDYSGYEYDHHSHPDYTKYFAAASGLVANKQKPESFSFVQPAEFESFFNTPLAGFGGEPKQTTAPQTFLPQTLKKPEPFNSFRPAASEPKDYFEESQKKQEAIKPGPHYISHQLPVPETYEDESKDDVETIPPPLSKKPKSKSGFGGFKDTYEALEATIKTDDEQVGQTKLDPYYGVGKSADYNTGKSSSTVSQYPAAAGYLANLKIPTSTLSPYQKYSFQPATVNYEALQSKYLAALVSTASPLKNTEKDNLNNEEKDDDDEEIAPSENIPENLKNKDCRRIHSPENAENMNCFVCEDALNRAKYTQCSYTASEEPVNQFAGSSIKYSQPVKAPSTFRYKRSPVKGRYSHDPYFEVSQRNRKYFDDYQKEQQVAESERQKDFKYKPYDPEEYESYSETQSSELLKQPGACEKVDRKGMTCTVCKNAKTGGNFEQCSYTSAPKEQKYAYVAEKKYDTDQDQPEETKTVIKQSSEIPKGTSSPISQTTEQTFSSASKSKIFQNPIPELAVAGTTIDETSAESPETEEDDDEAEAETDDEESDKEENGDKKLVNDDPYDVPEHFAASLSKKNTAEEDDASEENFDEYHYKLFPELNNRETAESRDSEQKSDATEQNQQDVEEVLAEFAKKDRSNCKKAVKNGMTCFLCVDKNKVQHEECMYIAESKPKPTHIAYHEVQRLKDPKKKEEDTEESKKIETPLLELTKKKKNSKKVNPSELTAASSNVYQSVVPFDLKASASAPDAERLEEDEDKKKAEPETPQEIDVGDEEGAYSHETKPVYSKLFGTSLPKYMVEKTEFEKDFDASAGF